MFLQTIWGLFKLNETERFKNVWRGTGEHVSKTLMLSVFILSLITITPMSIPVSRVLTSKLFERDEIIPQLKDIWKADLKMTWKDGELHINRNLPYLMGGDFTEFACKEVSVDCAADLTHLVKFNNLENIPNHWFYNEDLYNNMVKPALFLILTSGEILPNSLMMADQIPHLFGLFGEEKVMTKKMWDRGCDDVGEIFDNESVKFILEWRLHVGIICAFMLFGSWIFYLVALLVSSLLWTIPVWMMVLFLTSCSSHFSNIPHAVRPSFARVFNNSILLAITVYYVYCLEGIFGYDGGWHTTLYFYIRSYHIISSVITDERAAMAARDGNNNPPNHGNINPQNHGNMAQNALLEWRLSLTTNILIDCINPETANEWRKAVIQSVRLNGNDWEVFVQIFDCAPSPRGFWISRMSDKIAPFGVHTGQDNQQLHAVPRVNEVPPNVGPPPYINPETLQPHNIETNEKKDIASETKTSENSTEYEIKHNNVDGKKGTSGKDYIRELRRRHVKE